jgi:hypothetical protein
MKNQLFQRSGLFILLLAILLGKSLNAGAQAFDIRYNDSQISPTSSSGNHTTSFQLFENCDGGQAFTNLPIKMRINNGAPVTETWAGVVGMGLSGNTFCGSQTSVCATGNLLYYQSSILNYTHVTRFYLSGSSISNIQAEVIFLKNYQAANIDGNFGIYPQTFSAVASGMINSAPVVINPPVIFANVNQPVSYSSGATDADGDSLVYRLRPVSPTATYAPGFTYLNPITANPALALNSRTGLITFTPTVYNQTAGPGGIANKYIVGLDVDEYRKINGVATKIGTIQRNILINVISNANQSPMLTAGNLPPGSQAYVSIAPNTIIDAYPGSQVRMNFGVSDPDASNYVGAASNVTTILPQATFAVTLAQNPNSGTLYWTPTAADVRDEPYFFNVTATDDACPYPASVTNTYGIRVRSITGILPDHVLSANFQAYPNPFSQEVNFKIEGQAKAKTIIICNLLGQQIDKVELPVSGQSQQIIPWKNAFKYVAGTYLAKLISEDKTIQTLKFTKLQ